MHRIESWPERAVTLRRVARRDPVSPLRGGGSAEGKIERETSRGECESKRRKE